VSAPLWGLLCHMVADSLHPTPHEIHAAMLYADVLVPVKELVVADGPECMEKPKHLGEYRRDLQRIRLVDTWREEGLTILIHELVHHRDFLLGIEPNECNATRVAARWAYENGYAIAFQGQVLYGLRSGCLLGEVHDKAPD